MIIPTDTSHINDREWIAGGFPSRDVVKKRIISDSLNDKKHDNITDNPCNANDNIKVEILDDNPNDELSTSQVPISIIPEEPSDIPQETDPTDKTIATNGEDSPLNRYTR